MDPDNPQVEIVDIRQSWHDDLNPDKNHQKQMKFLKLATN